MTFGLPNQGVTIPVRGPYGDIGLLSATREIAARKSGSKLFTHVISRSSVDGGPHP